MYTGVYQDGQRTDDGDDRTRRDGRTRMENDDWTHDGTDGLTEDDDGDDRTDMTGRTDDIFPNFLNTILGPRF